MDSDSDYDPLRRGMRNSRRSSKQKRVRFTPETKIRMIELYKRYPCLWDTKSPYYWNRVERAKAEQSIADVLKYPAALINTKWQVLRNEFRIERNRMQRQNATETPQKSKWQFYSHLEFLSNHSNRLFNVSKRGSPSYVIHKPMNGSVGVPKPDPDENKDADVTTKMQSSPISVNSDLSMLIDDNDQPPRNNASACAYVAPEKVCLNDVSHCLEIIAELTKKIPLPDPDNTIRIFGDFVGSQLKQMKSKSCRSKCINDVQRVLIEWQNKDEEFVRDMQPQEEWHIEEDNELPADDETPIRRNTTDAVDASSAVPPIDTIAGQLESFGF